MVSNYSDLVWIGSIEGLRWFVRNDNNVCINLCSLMFESILVCSVHEWGESILLIREGGFRAQGQSGLRAGADGPTEGLLDLGFRYAMAKV